MRLADVCNKIRVCATGSTCQGPQQFHQAEEEGESWKVGGPLAKGQSLPAALQSSQSAIALANPEGKLGIKDHNVLWSKNSSLQNMSCVDAGRCFV